MTVYEKDSEVGGQARLIKKILSHNLPQTFLDYLDRQMQKFGVKVNFNAEIAEENIDDILSKEKPDVVVLASGSRPAKDGRSAVTTEPIPGWDRRNVFTYEDVLLGQAQIGQTVLIVDELADRITPGLAEMLAEEGKTVEVLTRWSHLAPNLHFWLDEHFAIGQLDLFNVKITPYSWVKEITDSGADCYNIHSGRDFNIAADTIVLVTMKYSNIALQELFENRGVECHPIGDARAPRWILNATHDGYKLGREL